MKISYSLSWIAIILIVVINQLEASFHHKSHFKAPDQSDSKTICVDESCSDERERVGKPENREIDHEYIENFQIPKQFMYDDDLMLGLQCTAEKVEAVQSMKMEKTDIGVASYPKTGTTLLQEIIWLLRHNADEEKAKAKNFERVPFIDDTYFDGITKFYKLEHPRHFKTHLPFRYLPKQVKEKGLKILYVYRNPKDALVSYYHFYKMIIGLGFFTGSWDDFFEMFHRVNKGVLYYGSMLKHYRDYWEHRDDPNMFVTSYETLLRHPYTEIKRIADFAELDYDDSLIDKVVKMTSFGAMKSNPATNFESIAEVCKFEVSPFMRKGQIGDWKNYFTAEQSAIMDGMIQKELGDTGIEFIYE